MYAICPRCNRYIDSVTSLYATSGWREYELTSSGESEETIEEDLCIDQFFENHSCPYCSGNISSRDFSSESFKISLADAMNYVGFCVGDLVEFTEETIYEAKVFKGVVLKRERLNEIKINQDGEIFSLDVRDEHVSLICKTSDNKEELSLKLNKDALLLKKKILKERN